MTDHVCLAGERHRSWLLARDGSVDREWIERCIKLGEYLIAERDGQPVGFLRWSWFWGKIPYMDMIRVEDSHRRCGFGSLLLSRLEEMAVSHGAGIVMTSCESDDRAPLEWHLKQGFVRTGEIEIPTVQSASEIFLVKRLR